MKTMILSCLFVALTLTACGSDDASTPNDEEGWVFNQSSGPDAGGDAEAEDTREGSDASGEVGREDTGSTDPGVDVFDDTGFQPDPLDPSLPALPEGVVEDALIGTTWYGVFRVTTEPAVTGIYLSASFFEDRVEMRNERVRTGQWRITGDGDVYIFGLDNDPAQFLLTPELDARGRLKTLNLLVPGWEDIAPYRLAFERRGTSRVPADELRGRWKAERDITNTDGTFRLAIRIDAQDFVEVGIVNQSNFVGIFNGNGALHSYSAGRHFWTMTPALGAENPTPIAGEVQGNGVDRRIYMFIEELGGNRVSLPFERVTQF